LMQLQYSFVAVAYSQTKRGRTMSESIESGGLPSSVSGIFPSLTMSGTLGPPRSECGIGALMPWNGKLYAVTYVSHRGRSGGGTGLYVIDENLRMKQHEASECGTYANRMVHFGSNQLVIGPHVVSVDHQVRTIKDLVNVRLAGTAEHLTNPKEQFLMLGMEGELFEVDAKTLKVNLLFDLTKELNTPGEGRVHFKDIHTYAGRVVVADNTYDAKDLTGETNDGRLAEWDGTRWTILDRTAYVCVTSRKDFTGTMFAMGWDRASVVLNVFVKADQKWTRYRLPKASHCYDHMWQTEWPRIREVEHERFLMDMHGMFYELSPWAYTGRIWGIRPISTHLWVHPDFCSFRGMLVLASDNASPSGDHNLLCAEPQSNLWFGKTDDLWKLGAPKGWGGPWWETTVKAGEVSDPYLMTGFDKKCLHLTHDSAGTVRITVEVDFQGHGAFKRYAVLEVPAGGYVHHEFPTGFSAHWIRVISDTPCRATAHLHYT
jgi:hypothetical protein